MISDISDWSCLCYMGASCASGHKSNLPNYQLATMELRYWIGGNIHGPASCSYVFTTMDFCYDLLEEKLTDCKVTIVEN